MYRNTRISETGIHIDIDLATFYSTVYRYRFNNSLKYRVSISIKAKLSNAPISGQVLLPSLFSALFLISNYLQQHKHEKFF